ncbi:MAG: FMN-binding negative transcriptional regulator [Spirulinaceae cyanobacterium SM2_1_0]|nr:FMN-binding negative transcriptional regulator [Spirulinaceae cyanobacterium SM2_1_0]
MYRPTLFQEDNRERLLAFMQANSFATLVSLVDGVPYASHIPLVATQQAEVVILRGHLAKQNPQWQAFADAQSLAIFTGPHAYISPQLYERHESVPTWNYIAVHAYGTPAILTRQDSPEQMAAMLDEMIEFYEETYKEHWHGLSHSFREGMMNGMVGFEMAVTRLEGKYKLSQNRSHTERENVSEALLQSTDPPAREVGIEMKR